MIYIVFLVLLGFLGSGLLMFRWAASEGQFENVEDGALVIFDADEPQGKTTDSFPNSHR